MKEDVINILNTVNIEVVGDNKVKIKTNPARDSLPIEVVETIIENVVKQCSHQKEKNLPEGLVEAVAKEYDEHLFKLARSWKIVSFILAAIIVGLLIWR